MAPFALIEVLGKPVAYSIYLLVGIAFGTVLEMAGFADSRRLAAQFYLKDMTVLKVMFTAIVTAMVLVSLSSSLMILDYNRLWVNPTYLLPGIVGGLIMGAGFILGGFCPGTSLVAMANLKIDGIVFFIGASLGIFLFGETVGSFGKFWHSTSMGRFTLPQWLGLPVGWVVLLVVLMALGMFWGGEKLERIFSESRNQRDRKDSRPIKLGAAVALVCLALAVLALGQPGSAARWTRIASEKQPLLDSRQIQIHPGELVELSHNDQINLLLLDLRDEADFNVFHLIDSKRVTLDEIREGLIGLQLIAAPINTVTVLISNGEVRATEAWKLLMSDGVPNVYVLEGGINNWLDIFPHAGCEEQCRTLDSHTTDKDPETLDHVFLNALGSARPSANPDALTETIPAFTSKVKLQTRKTLGGGCG